MENAAGQKQNKWSSGTRFSKSFNCIPHDLLIAKLDVCNFDKEALSLIYSYLKNRKLTVLTMYLALS